MPGDTDGSWLMQSRGFNASHAFEVAQQFPVGDRGVVERYLLLASGIQQVFEHEVPERLASYLAAFEGIDRFVK
jgi:hypothetical protein